MPVGDGREDFDGGVVGEVVNRYNVEMTCQPLSDVISTATRWSHSAKNKVNIVEKYISSALCLFMKISPCVTFMNVSLVKTFQTNLLLI